MSCDLLLEALTRTGYEKECLICLDIVAYNEYKIASATLGKLYLSLIIDCPIATLDTLLPRMTGTIESCAHRTKRGHVNIYYWREIRMEL